mmetsp:Transcript_22160/g.71783  ORF Transcript_22160/g.71783 Transcript_22160/m.71783 type:complete len:471 (-) Transcript_22160:125-1537(-)
MSQSAEEGVALLAPAQSDDVAEYGAAEVEQGPEGGFGSDERRAAVQAPRGLSWPFAATLLLAKTIGAGVLQLPYAISELGFVLGVATMVLFAAVSAYTGTLLGRCQNKLGGAALTLGDLAGSLYGSRVAWVVFAMLWTNFLFVNADYFLVAGQSMRLLFFGWDACDWGFALLAAATLLPLAQVRELTKLEWPAAVSLATLSVVLAACVAQGVRDGTSGSAGSSTEAVFVPKGGLLGLLDVFAGLAGTVYAYGNQDAALDVRGVMTEPDKFDRVVIVTAAVSFVVYTACAVGFYSVYGADVPGFILDILPYNWTRRVAGAAMFVHIALSYVITNQILGRHLHLAIRPQSANDWGVSGSLVWLAISGAALTACFVISEAVPFFENLSGIIGALLSAPIFFFFPAFFTLALKRKHPELEWDFPGESAVLHAIMALATAIFAFGLAGEVTQVVANFGEENTAPFACHTARSFRR